LVTLKKEKSKASMKTTDKTLLKCDCFSEVTNRKHA